MLVLGLIQIQLFPDVPEPEPKTAVQAALQEPGAGRDRLSGAGMDGKRIQARKQGAAQRRKTGRQEAAQHPGTGLPHFRGDMDGPVRDGNQADSRFE